MELVLEFWRSGVQVRLRLDRVGKDFCFSLVGGTESANCYKGRGLLLLTSGMILTFSDEIVKVRVFGI